MPDTPVEPTSRGPYDPPLEHRVTQLEEDVRDIKVTNERLLAVVGELRDAVIRIEATLPHLATKADVAELRSEMRGGLAEKPSRAYIWGVMTALITAYACGLAALAILK